MTESIMEEALRIVSTDRREAYGHPYQDFTRIGRVWGAILDIPDIPPEKVALMYDGAKSIRETVRRQRDNLVDKHGYTHCLDLVYEWEREHGTESHP